MFPVDGSIVAPNPASFTASFNSFLGFSIVVEYKFLSATDENINEIKALLEELKENKEKHDLLKEKYHLDISY